MLFSGEVEGNMFHAHRIKDCNSLTLTNAVPSLSTAQIHAADTVVFGCKTSIPLVTYTGICGYGLF